ncbi:MAG: hypothetical protein Q7S04_01465 [Candidatus Moranbacteria bacterium]|nr:hypothetical protein [Candidatus Moranbacteria bacterium]
MKKVNIIKSIAFTLAISVVLAMVATYAYNKFFAWDRYWDGTVVRSNEKVAFTTKYLIGLLGAEKVAKLTQDDIKNNLSNLGYNLFFEIRNGQSLVTSSFASYSSATEERYSLPCSTSEKQPCSVTLLEDKGAPARNLNLKFQEWLTSGVKDPLNQKYDNFTIFFLFFLLSIFPIITSLKMRGEVKELRLRESLIKKSAALEEIEKKYYLLDRNNLDVAITKVELKLREKTHEILSKAYGNNYFELDIAIPKKTKEKIQQEIHERRENTLEYATIGAYEHIICSIKTLNYPNNPDNYHLFEEIFGKDNGGKTKGFLALLTRIRNLIRHEQPIDNPDLLAGAAAVEWLARSLDISLNDDESKQS